MEVRQARDISALINDGVSQSRTEPTYISRPVVNAQDIHDWAVGQGFKNVVPPEKMHVTVAYSKTPFDAGSLAETSPNITVAGGERSVKKLGDDEVPVLRFESELHDYLARNTKVLDTLRDTNVLDDKTVEDLEKAIDTFKLEFQTGEGKPLISAGKEEFEEIAPEDIAQEQIVKGRR